MSVDGGVTAGHSNGIEIPGLTLGALTKYTLAIGAEARVDPWVGGTNTILAHSDIGGDNGGMILRPVDISGDMHMTLFHGNGTNYDSPINLVGTPMVAGTLERDIITWDGTTVKLYQGGIETFSGAFSRAWAATTADFVLLNATENTNRGAQVALNHMLLFNDVLSENEIASISAGKLAALQKLIAWYKGIEVPGLEELSETTAVERGTVPLRSHASDAFYGAAKVPDYLQTATVKLFSRNHDRHEYERTVPWRFLINELGDLMNLSEPDIPQAASQLVDLANYYNADKARRKILTLVGITPNRLERTVTLTLKERELNGFTAISTDRLISKTSPEMVGLARADVGGAERTVSRSTVVWLEQEANLLYSQAFDDDGQAFVKVGPFEEAMNHIGALYQDATTNRVIDSAFAGGFTNWSATESTVGNVVGVVGVRAFPKEASGNSIAVTGEASQENFISPSSAIAVLSSVGNYRLSFVHSADASEAADWAAQRSSDNRWWHDALKLWQVSKVWNSSNKTGFDGTSEKAVRSSSNPITATSNENWTLQLGVDNATSTHRFFQVDLTEGKLLYAPIVTGSATVTTVADTTFDELTVDVSDPVRQLVYAGRNTFSFTMTAIQDGSHLDDGDEHELYAWQYNTSEKDYDVVTYQKQSGQNVRFAYERWTDVAGVSTLNARATYDVSIVPGTEYIVEAISTSESDGELGLPARTMRLRVNKANGVDATATAVHDVTEKFTKIWYGCSPKAGSKRAMNYLSMPRWTPRCIPDEERVAT